MKIKILIADFIHPLFIDEMVANGCEVDYEPEIDQEGVERIIANYHGLVINSKTKLHRSQIEKAKLLKFIGRMGSGMEIIDTQYAASQGIACINSPEGNRDAVGEHALGMLLSLLNNLHLANEQVKQGRWLREQNRGVELGGKTIGILGFGNTGQAFAEKLQGFQVNVLAYDKYKSGFSTEYIKESSVDGIFENADVLSLHLPMSAETKGWIDFDFLGRFKKNFFLINTARGKILNTADLIRLIQSGKIMGAALDVLENEDIAHLSGSDQTWFSQLVTDKRILLTPHIAGWTKESKEKIARVLADKIKKNLEIERQAGNGFIG